MGKQVFNFKGMMRDLDPAKTSNNYAYEIRNLRITAQEDATFMTLTTELGNTRITLETPGGGTPTSVAGTMVGYCVLNRYLIVFLVSEGITYINRLEPGANGKMIVTNIFHGRIGMSEDRPIETIGIYENEDVQNVYWIDGVNQPRTINIKKIYNFSNINAEFFDFNPSLQLEEQVTITKSSYSGLFPAGTVQYFMTYYNKHRQQTPVFYQSPIYYTAYENRGASTEDTISNSFHIKAVNLDTHFDYVRIFSVVRSSQNGTTVCKKVCDLKIEENVTDSYKKYISANWGSSSNVTYVTGAYDFYILDSSGAVCDLSTFYETNKGMVPVYSIPSTHYVFLCKNGVGWRFQAQSDNFISLMIFGNSSIDVRSWNSNVKRWGGTNGVSFSESTLEAACIDYIDNNTGGEVVPSSSILFAGGANIIPSTMEQKDNALFFGNYKTTSIISQEQQDIIKNGAVIGYSPHSKRVSKGSLGGYYVYQNQLGLSAADITTFKGGETYSFGVILQDNRGQWTNVIPIGKEKNNLYPIDYDTFFYPTNAIITFNAEARSIIESYKKIKIVRAPSLNSSVCQGVLCPTVFNKNRASNKPYCQSSWFFRDVTADSIEQHRPLGWHNGNIVDGGAIYSNVGEIQGARTNSISYYEYDTASLSDMDFFIDCNTLTLNSPDIEFGENLNAHYKMKIVGYLPITFGSTSMSLNWSSPPYDPTITNYEHDDIVHNANDDYAYEMDLRSFVFNDATEEGGSDIYSFPVYPWHRNGSLNSFAGLLEGSSQYAMLSTKVMASLRGATSTKYIDGVEYDITGFKIYQEDDVPLLIEEDGNNFLYNGAKYYKGSSDSVLLTNTPYATYKKTPSGAYVITTVDDHESNDPVRMQYKSSKHGVFSLKSNENEFQILPNVGVVGDSATSASDPYDGYSVKKITTEITSGSTQIIAGYLRITNIPQECRILHLHDVVKVNLSSPTTYNSKLWFVKEEPDNSIGKVTLAPLNEWYFKNVFGGYIIMDNTVTEGSIIINDYRPVFKLGNRYYSVSCHSEYDHHGGEWTITVDADWTLLATVSPYNVPSISQKSLSISSSVPYLYLAELYIDNYNNNNIQNPTWIVASTAQDTGNYAFRANIGDTYYQRYDCLKTYPHSPEDQNQIVEIFSFMCETKVNIDGRYDTLRGLRDNTNILGSNFNLINKAYTQEDNFFTYSYLSAEDYSVNAFPNQVIWTKAKVYGSDIDAWTEIPATSTLAMNGSLGQITALKLWNNDLICFQDMGISKIMYNERTALSTEQGIPIEIANSEKVEGSIYISNQVGCSNKHTVQTTQEGLYFIDSNKRELYKLSKGLEPLSKSKGFNTYFNDKAINYDKLKVFYDPKLKDIYVSITKETTGTTVNECLVYNEQVGEFTSFFDYNVSFMFPYNGEFYSVPKHSTNIWRQFSGNYLMYFNTYNNYSIEFISAENPLVDKTFFNTELRADVLNGSITDVSQATETGNHASINIPPFKTIRVWNEYQDTGTVNFTKVLRHGENLAQKFRIWRGEIGRDTTKPLDRIRSPWARIKLSGGNEAIKTVIHDVAVSYV